MPQQNLVIVESPAKARTIGRILGQDFRVMASMGHVRDLPERSLGVDVRNGFRPLYQETRTRGNVVKQLREAAATSCDIYLAPDPDREGEAIAWHLQELLAPAAKKAVFHRVVFHEITKTAVQRAFEHPGQVEMNRVNSQQARRVLDRLVGYQVSPLLWKRIEGGSSAGRVQTVALRIVCERERIIRAFVPVEYWVIHALLSPEAAVSGHFRAKLARIDNEKAEVTGQETADRVVAALRGEGPLAVAAVETKPKKRYAPPPFITSTLQQAAGATLRFGASRTMQLAQQLYEGIDLGDGPSGLITYMRTDSVAVADEAVRACRELIAARFGPDHVPEKPNTYRSRAGAQGAHEAIRPTDVTRAPETVAAFLDPAQLKLYTLIWKRFVASQMKPAELAVTGVEVDKRAADGHVYRLKAEATAVVFPGFTSVYQARESDDEEEEADETAPAALLAALRPGLACRLDELKPEQKFTEPPPRFSEATLIRELEGNGIGRPSTYASIVNTIQQRKYVDKEKGKLVPTELGFQVTDFLVGNLNDLFQVGFTADMEAKLDQVEEGKVEWTAMLQEFHDELCRHLGVAKMAGAPEGEVAGGMLGLFAPVREWAPPTKRGKRTYSDQEFVASLGEQFQKQSRLSERQWSALLRLATKYRDQMPGLAEFAAAHGLDLDAQAGGRGGEADVDKAAVADLFAAMATVTFSPPAERKGRTYDDGAFIRSLQEQVEGGKALSSKQLAALSRIARRYREQIANFADLATRLGLADTDEAGEEADPAKVAEAAAEIAALLGQLAAVTNWEAPVKKGRRVYDDQEFYQSLQRQFTDRKSLSPKQVAALRRLAKRYGGGTPGDPSAE